MLQVDPMSSSNQSEDKAQAQDFSTSIGEDPFSDLFDQLISQNSSNVGDNDNQSSIFEALDFPVGNTLSNGTRFGDKHFSNHINSKIKSFHQHRQPHIRYTQSQDILPSQVHGGFSRFEKPNAAISGAELLSLEGKLPVQALPVRLNSSLSSNIVPVPPLRRKTRFSTNNPETLRHRNHKVSKSPGSVSVSVSVEASKMTHPYYYQPEVASFHERFENISLQSPGFKIPRSPQTPEASSRDEPPRNVPIAKSSQPNLMQRETIILDYVPSHEEPPTKVTEFDPLIPPTSCSPFIDQSQYQPISFNAHREVRNGDTQFTASPPPSLSPSWLHSPTSTESFDFTISPHLIQSSWPYDFPDTSASYYENVGASQSAPVLTQSGAGVSAQCPIAHYESSEMFISTNSSTAYTTAAADPFHSTDFDVTHPFPSPNATVHAQTPSARSSSPCPSPPPDPKSNTKNRRRSKSSRRKSSAGALKSSSASSTGMGFVNFTPDDSQRILSGVAPSGSSKTKARREQEANEKKRKLSLAAEKLIKEAGGDVEKLRAEGIFM